jgi:arylsulfatase A-like enzyme
VSSVLALACAAEEPTRVSRPLEGDIGPVTAAGVTRPGFHVAAGETRRALRSPLPAGRVGLAIAPGGSREASIEVDLESPTLAGGALRLCTHEFAADIEPFWQECGAEIPEALQEASLSIRVTGPAASGVVISSPLHTRFGSAPAKPPIFLVVLDAARADVFRSFDPASPFGERLSVLARDGIAFTQARTSSPWTRPAVASLMTGLTPWRHRVVDRQDSLPPRFETLAEALAGQGYSTRAYVTNPNVLPVFGFHQGFDVFEDIGSVDWKAAKVDAGQVFARVREALPSAATRPEFIWIHLMDPHDPYRPPRAARAKARSLQRARTSPKRVAYDGEILDVDRKLDGFLEELRSAGLYERSLIAVVSDHGEAFNEHGAMGHGKQMFEESIWIPAVVKLPGNARAGEESAAPIGLEDIHQLLLDASTHGSGAGAIAALEGDAARRQIAVLALGERRKSAITEEGWKLIVDHAAQEEKLFDLAADPGETSDLSGKHPERARALRRRLDLERSRGEAGLHLRWCGGSRPSIVEMRVTLGEREVHRVEFEPADEVDAPAAGVAELRLDLTPRPNPLTEALRETGDLAALENQGRSFADEDELLLTEPTGQPLDLRDATVEVVSPEGWDLLLGGAREARPGTDAAFSLADHATELVASPSDPLGCPAGTRERPLLRAWRVVDPEAVRPDALTPETLERLRALGYDW